MDKALKQRLIGALVLIALAVIILPMLLGGRPESSQQQTEQIELPARPDGVAFETRRFPLADEGTTPQQQTDTVHAAEQPDPAAANQQSPKLANSELAKQSVGEQVKDAQASPLSENPAGRFAVQVASLGSEANAKKLQADLEANGFDVISDKIESDVGRLNRVRVGPFDSEAEAATAVKKIQSQIEGMSPRMVDLDPTVSTQDTNPSDPLVRWVVQLGSFTENSNAENLVKQVRGQGLSAYSEKVTSSSGTSINRVRVGPFLQREDATKAQQSLKSSLSINGVVMSAD